MKHSSAHCWHDYLGDMGMGGIMLVNWSHCHKQVAHAAGIPLITPSNPAIKSVVECFMQLL